MNKINLESILCSLCLGKGKIYSRRQYDVNMLYSLKIRRGNCFDIQIGRTYDIKFNLQQQVILKTVYLSC